ncbi:hypothetical protein [Buchnera aphidicola]|uniref:hypothetical protein n=1 Tax=Buchnera aphidicola TaxID=9 RepID=UPI000A50E59C|nr:hypothetical protein [Buchnera aphidicola]
MSNLLVLTLNCGSSSLKFSVIDPKRNSIVLLGLVDFLQSSKIKVSWKINFKEYSIFLNKNKDYKEIVGLISDHILKRDLEIFNRISCVGHRVVHGGSKMNKSVVLDEEVLKYIKKVSCFAPLHNPLSILGIQTSFDVFPHLKKKM